MVATVLTSYTTNVFGADYGSIEYAENENSRFFEGIVGFKWQQNLWEIGDFKLNLYKQIGYSKWQKLSNLNDEFANNCLEFNPVFRLENSFGFIGYSLGVSAMTNVSMDRNIDGGWLYFNNFFMIGLNYQNLYIATKLQHYSTNAIFYPNINNNFYILEFGWNYSTN